MASKTPLSFENALSELEALVKQLEMGDLPLADALDAYEKGVKLSKQCQQLLDKAELKIQKLAGTSSSEE